MLTGDSVLTCTATVMEGASSTCGGGRTQDVEGAGALPTVTEAMAHLSPHVSLAHLHYLPKLLY